MTVLTVINGGPVRLLAFNGTPGPPGPPGAYNPGGPDVAVADGGTGASDAATARTNLGLLALATKATVAIADINDDAVTNTKLANVATSTFKGRVTAAIGDPEDLTGTQATSLLDAFTTALKGVVPASGGGAVNYLRADGTFNVPPGTATLPVIVTKTADQANSTTTLADVTDLTFAVVAGGIYVIDVTIFSISAVAATGLVLAMNGPVIGTGYIRYGAKIPTSATTLVQGAASVYEQTIAGTDNTVLSPSMATMSAYFVAGATAGTLAVRFRSSVAASAVTIQRGSWGRQTRIA